MQMTWSSSLKELQERLILGKTNMEGIVLRVNMAKPRSWYLGSGSMCFRSLVNTPVVCVSRVSAQTPFSVVVVPVGYTRNAVVSLALWRLNPASGVNGGCTGQADGRLMTEVTMGWEKLEVVLLFCYIGDCSSSGGSCELASVTRCRVTWGKFNEILPVLSPSLIPHPLQW